MIYTSIYRTLCAEAEAGGHLVKLRRFERDQWGLELLLAPAQGMRRWRAGAFAFGDIAELDRYAAHLLAWLRSDQRARPRQNERRPIR